MIPAYCCQRNIHIILSVRQFCKYRRIKFGFLNAIIDFIAPFQIAIQKATDIYFCWDCWSLTYYELPIKRLTA